MSKKNQRAPHIRAVCLQQYISSCKKKSTSLSLDNPTACCAPCMHYLPSYTRGSCPGGTQIHPYPIKLILLSIITNIEASYDTCTYSPEEMTYEESQNVWAYFSVIVLCVIYFILFDKLVDLFYLISTFVNIHICGALWLFLDTPICIFLSCRMAQ